MTQSTRRTALKSITGMMASASAPAFYMKNASDSRRRIGGAEGSEFLLAAACDSDGTRNVTYVSKSGTGAGIFEFMPPDQQARNTKMCVPADAEDIHAHDCSLTSIQCQRLSTILGTRGIKRVDLFVLDVEGAEHEVIKTLDLDHIDVHFFLVELDGKSPEKDKRVRCYLVQHGFEPLGRLDLNELWRNKYFPEEGQLYGPAIPPPHWSHCFVSFDGTSFFQDRGRRMPDGNESQRRKNPADGALDVDFEEVGREAENMRLTQRARPGHHKAIEDDGDLFATVTIGACFGVPLLLFMWKKLRRRSK